MSALAPFLVGVFTSAACIALTPSAPRQMVAAACLITAICVGAHYVT